MFMKRNLPSEEPAFIDEVNDELLNSYTLENYISKFNQIDTARKTVLTDVHLVQTHKSNKSFFIDEPNRKRRKIKTCSNKGGSNSKPIKKNISEQSLIAVSTSQKSNYSNLSSHTNNINYDTASKEVILSLSKDDSRDDCILNKGKFNQSRHKQNDFSCKSCMSCEWKFPKYLSIQEINYHINQCIDGFGKRNKAYLLCKHDAPNSSSTVTKSKK